MKWYIIDLLFLKGTELSVYVGRISVPTFLGLCVTKPVVTQGTDRCQMKDMNKIFPEIL